MFEKNFHQARNPNTALMMSPEIRALFVILAIRCQSLPTILGLGGRVKMAKTMMIYSSP